MAIVDITKPMALDETLQGTNTKMDAVILKLQGIIDALGLDTSVYKPKGNITCAALVPALLIDDNLGNVYNVTDNGTTTSDFVEGAGKPIHVGDNVAIVDVGTGGQSEYKFDLLAGMVDLTNYVQKSQTAGLLKNDGTVDTKDYAEKVAGATADSLAGLDANGNLTDSGWNGAKDTTSISGNPISISGLKANQLAINPIITFEPIQAGSGTPSPSNIRAISGYDKVDVLSCGKNLFDVNALRQGTIGSDGTYYPAYPNYRCTQYLLLEAGTYTVSRGSATSWWKAYRYSYNGDKTPVGWVFNSENSLSESFTLNVTMYVMFAFDYIPTESNQIQLEKNNQATTYVPYHKSTSISESLGQTVYGGTLDVRTGKLTSTHKLGDLGDLSWGNFSTGVFRASATTDVKMDVASHVCETYTCTNNYNTMIATNNTFCIITVGSERRIFVHDDRYSDYATFAAAITGVKYAYELSTPFTIQLTPHEISLLKDYAYVSTNGTSIALDYHNGEMASLADVNQLGETVNELGEYINIEHNEFDTAIDISSATASSRYTFPSDGYIFINGRNNTSGYIRAYAYGRQSNAIAAGISVNITGTQQMASLYVRKGMRCYIDANVTGFNAQFIPLV